MGKKIFIFLLAIILFIPFVNCRKNQPPQEKSPSEVDEKGSPGDLRVTFVSPKGKTDAPHQSETIVVVFDQPMIPLEALQEDKELPLHLHPSFKGEYRWLNPKTLTFSPRERFPYSTEIRVSVPAGTKSFQGASLKQDFTWTFRTIVPRLISHFPGKNQKWIPLDSPVVLVFNQSIQQKKAREFLSVVEISPDNKENPVGFHLSSPSKKQLEEEEIKAAPDEVLWLEPEEKFKPDHSYHVEVRAGLPAQEGPLGMEKSQHFKFETFKKFTFMKLEMPEKNDPSRPLRLHFSNPVKYKDFIGKIHFEPSVEIPDYYFHRDYASSTLWLTLPLEPETDYSMVIESGLKDKFGNELEKDVSLKFSTSSYPPSVSIHSGQGIIESYGDLRFPLNVMNTEQVFLQGARVQKHEVIPLLSRRKIFWSSEKLIKEKFFDLEKNLEIEIQPNKRKIFPVELKPLLPDHHGFVFLQLDTHSSEKWDRYPKTFLQVTNIGLSGKFSPENNLIWVTELKTGEPLSGAKVEIRDQHNKIRWQGKTGPQGKVQTPGWKPLGIRSDKPWQKPRQWVLVTHENDSAIISSEWGTGIHPYHFGIRYDWKPQPERFQGYLFTEKGIYRAGEDVHIKGIIRQREKGRWQLPSIQEVECKILDPFQKSVFHKKIELDSYGSLALDFRTDEKAPLGPYQIQGKIPPLHKKGKPFILHGSFRIEAFRPARFQVHLRTSEESYVFGDTYQAEVTGTYLFGGAMSRQKISWHLRLNPTSFNPPGHPDYIFGNQMDGGDEEGEERSRLLSSGESTLDEQGKLHLSSKLMPEKERDSMLATLEATVQGPSRNSISSRTQNIVHRGEYYIGLKPGALFLKKGKELQVNLISVRPDGTLISGKEILLSLLKREWHSARKKTIGGRYNWMSEKKDTQIDSRLIQTKKTPQKASFLPEKSGFYILRAEGKDRRGNTITTTTYFYVTGEDYIPWKRRDDDTIELVADREEYAPGEAAKILVKSPFQKAKALVTVETDLILENRILEIQGSSEEITVPLRSDYIPNVYICVLMVKGRTSPRSPDRDQDLGKPSFKIGYINLKVNPSEKRLQVDIHKDQKVYKPQQKVNLKLKVKDWKGQGIPASLTVAVVDVGVLNLIGYKTPHPFTYFYADRPLSVQTSDTRFHLIEQMGYGVKGEEVSGGGREMAKAAAPSLAQVTLRGDFKATAYWNPSLTTDEQGNASLSFTLPDNLTTFRIMALAQTTDSRFGHAQSDFQTSKSLLLMPSLPRLARLGDRFQGGVTVHNFTSRKGKVSLSCEEKGISLLNKNRIRRFSLEAGESKEILYDFEVKKPGKATLAFKAKMGEETDGLEIAFPLNMPRPTETVALFEKTQESRKDKIRIPDGIFARESHIQVTASASALSGLKGTVDFLTSYPYLCLEQRLSALLPYLVAPDVILEFNLSPLNQEEIREYVQKNLPKIYDYQKENGGFGFWPESLHDSPFLTCYALFALAKAQKAGYQVNQGRMEEAARYLRNLLAQKSIHKKYPYNLRTWRTIQAFTLYCLALVDKPEPSYSQKLFSEREELSLFGKTLLLKALVQGKDSSDAREVLLKDLTNYIKVTPTMAHFQDDEGRGGGWIYSSTVRTTAFILQSMMEVGTRHSFLPQMARWLVEKRKAKSWRSTQENFFVFYALNEFYRRYEKIQPDFKVKISLETKHLLEEIFQDRPGKTVTAQTSLASFTQGKTVPLNISLKGKGTLYYETRMTYTPRYKLPPRDRGFGLSKEILTVEGKPLQSVKAGSLVVVKLQIVVPRESLFVVVDDPLPAGLVAVNPTFVTESQEQQRRLRQMEDKKNRIWWRGFNHTEMHDDRVLLFAHSLPPGIHTHTYLARALTYGRFHTPGTKAEEMYSPEVFGRGEELLLEITK
ncbi:MAG: Ig-like domain-containing protein [Candidatus Aminicenantes bacterium]